MVKRVVKKQSSSPSVKKTKTKKLFRNSGSSSSSNSVNKPAKTAVVKPPSSVSCSSAGKRKRVGKLHLHHRGGDSSSD